MARFSIYLTFLIALQWGGTTSHAKPQGNLPAFLLAEDCGATLCIKVNFADGEEDVIAADEYHAERHAKHDIFKGRLRNTKAKAVVILGKGDKEDLIVFKSDKVPGCRKYNVDLEGQGETSCMPDPNWDEIMKEKTVDADNLTPPNEEETRAYGEIRSAEDRQLNANGYTLKVAVYYDEVWKAEFGAEANARVDAIMALVDEQYSESTFATNVDVEVVAVEYAQGQNWNRQWYTGSTGAILCARAGCVDGDITAASPHDVNLWVFLTGSASRGGAAGMAWESVVCNSNKALRTSITKYLGQDEYTAEVVTHELGHNLALKHDFDDDVKQQTGQMVPRKVNGVDCAGYMDYISHTDGWSACSVQDFTNYFNRYGASDYCLAPIENGGGSVTTSQPPTTADGGTGGNVCSNLKLKTKTWGKEISWKFGSCESPQGYGENINGKYANNQEFTIECCQPAGTYELDCKDKYGDGWHGGSIEIGGTEYCKDFTSGSSKKQQVQHSGSTSNNKCVNLKLTTKTWGKEISWKFGSCESPQGYGENINGKYANNQEFTIECCQPAGTYELDCKDKYGDGWHGGSIEIGGTEYCKDFTSGRSKKQQVQH